MKRILGAVIAIAAALVPVAATAAPTPSPPLSSVLAAAPTGFTELTSSSLHGQFTAHDYAVNTGSNKASEIEATLNHDGFVDGYGKTWTDKTATHALLEAVIAFTGGKGARDWLTQAEAGDKADPSYVRADSISGITPYYGVHFADSASSSQGDDYSFAKGNDVFLIAAVSQADDVLTLAKTQTMTQFNAAPSETIPSSQWPENQSSGGSSSSFSGLLYVIAAVVLVAVIVVGFVMRSRRRVPVAAVYGPMAGATVGVPPPMAPAGVQLSEDGKYWWDGQNWRDAEHEAPPSAQRSSDGSQWWDGRNWRPVPQAGQQPPGSSPF